MTHCAITSRLASRLVRSVRRALTLVLAIVALGVGHDTASAQSALLHDVDNGPDASTSGRLALR